jgi:four helix bundle suffix protein
MEIWDKNHRLVNRLKELARTPNANYETFQKAIENPEPAICANTMIHFIKTTTYLLARQIKSFERTFLDKGGLREKMTKARIDKRNNNQ